MANRLEIKDNYLYIIDNDTEVIISKHPSKDTNVMEYEENTLNPLYVFSGIQSNFNSRSQEDTKHRFDDLLDLNGNAFTTIDLLRTFINQNTAGFNTSQEGEVIVASDSKKLGGVDADDYLVYKGRDKDYSKNENLIGKQGIYGVAGVPSGIQVDEYGLVTFGVLLSFNNENIDSQIYLTKDGRMFLTGFLNGTEISGGFSEVYGTNNLTKKVITDLLGNFQSFGLDSKDNRTIEPIQASDYFNKGLQFYFSSMGGLTSSSSNANWVDLLVLNSYGSDGGGKMNALAFDKTSNKITHFQGNYFDTVWTKIGMLYTEATLTYDVLINLLKNSGTDVTLPLNDAGIDVTFNRIVVRNSAGKLKHIDRDKFVTEDDMGNTEYIDYLNAKITNTLII